MATNIMARTNVAAVVETAPPTDWDAELRGVRTARLAAVLSLLGIVFLLVLPIVLVFVLGYGLALAPGIGGAQAALATVEMLAEAVLGGAAVVLAALVLYTVSFRRLSGAAAGFGAPFGLSVVGLIGAFLLFAAFGILLLSVVQAIGCLSATVPAACYTDANLAAVFPVFLLGGVILAFVGWVGILLGVYRIGKRYSSKSTRIGAILYMVPLVNLVAPILVLIGIQGIVSPSRRGSARMPPRPERRARFSGTEIGRPA